jgi:triacylglycerol lipase
MFLAPFLLLSGVLAQSAPNVTVSLGLLSDLKLFAEYSAAAYCPENYVKLPENSSICPSDICPELQTPSNVRVHVFTETQKSHAFSILTLDHTMGLITISFRGTVTNNDWKTNVE